MELPGDSTVLWYNLLPLFATVLVISATIFILFISRHRTPIHDGSEIELVTNESGRHLPSTTQKARDKTITYRLQGIPKNQDEHGVEALVKKALKLESDIDVKVCSLARSPYPQDGKIATLNFSKTPNCLSDEGEWKFSLRQKEGENHTEVTLIVDTHFRGFTPLQSDSDCVIDCIVISGLGGHAFGSFKEKRGSYIWLRDSLPKDLPRTRILIYGYDSQIPRSMSVQSIRDLANRFRTAIKVIRKYDRGSSKLSTERPLLLLGHSLGGIIAKEALIRMKDGDKFDKANLKSTYAILFFGVPNQGMEIKSLLAMVRDQPNRYLVESLSRISEVLREQWDKFPKVFNFKDSVIISFYETEMSPTVQEKDGIWSRTGEPAFLVDIASATHARPWETGERYIQAINRNHSEMVKFSQNDEDYRTVLHYLEEFTKSACNVIENRFVESATQKMLEKAIDSVAVDPFLTMLSAVNQADHISEIPPMDRDQPDFYWIFRNMDFWQWHNNSTSQVLWLSGPPKYIHHVSSCIVQGKAMNTEYCVLYFFCSAAVGEKSIVSLFVRTLLHQIVCCSPIGKKKSIVREFLYTLVDSIFKKKGKKKRSSNQEGASDLEGNSDHEGASDEEMVHSECPQDTMLKKILDAPPDELWTALKAVLADDQERELLIVVDGLDEVKHEKDEFLKGVRGFVTHLLEGTSKVKILLTSRPQTKLKEVFDGLPYIEHDKERKECLASLHFDNSRYDKISPELEGSCEWIWTHSQYREWSVSSTSRLLYIQGKPGSGKSTLTKYFNENLQKREPDAESAVVARFFYSYREGEPQKSHYNMLRSILYDILRQHEAFFYHRFQDEYRRQVELQERDRGDLVQWSYDSLKRVLLSLQDHTPAKRLYLIMDAMDESYDEDRSEILNLLFDLCSKTKNSVVKVFVASRPVGPLESRISELKFIRMQDQTKKDISRVTSYFLERLKLTGFFDRAMEYIVEKAEGVFLWVNLVGKELLNYHEQGRPEEDIFNFLKNLPTELEIFYEHMLQKIGRDKDVLQTGVKMFQFVLYAYRPLAVSELLHALGIPDNPDAKFTASDDSFYKLIPLERRITLCGGNFLEIRQHLGSDIVQVMHQTVREFFLRTDGHVSKSEFRISKKDAHVCISITCIRYLMLCAANMAKRLPDIDSWTSEHYESCAQYLDERPLANYALCYLKHHIDECNQDARVLRLAAQFFDELACNRTVYLLERWVDSQLKKTLLRIEEGRAAEDFRNKVLQAAVRNGFLQATNTLLIAGANADWEDKSRRTPLSWAAHNGHEAVVKVLLGTEQVGINSKDNVYGLTPLSWAARNGHDAVVNALLAARKVDVDSNDSSRRTPLSWAAQNGYETVVKALLATGKVDVDSKDNNEGRTPLFWAARNGHEAVVNVLLATGKVDVNIKDNNYRQTPLSCAAQNGHEAVVKALLATGNVDVDAWDNYYKRTPLLWAAKNGHEKVVELLKSHGCLS